MQTSEVLALNVPTEEIKPQFTNSSVNGTHIGSSQLEKSGIKEEPAKIGAKQTSMEALGDLGLESGDDDLAEVGAGPPKLSSVLIENPSKIQFSPISEHGSEFASKENEELFDPCGLSPREGTKKTVPDIMESLKFNAVELHVEGLDTTRLEIFSPAQCYVVLFEKDSTSGAWKMMEKSETVRCMPHIKIIKKFKLRAATELDRSEELMVAFFDSNMEAKTVTPTEALGFKTFSASQLLKSTKFMIKRPLEVEKWGFWGNAHVVLTLDLIKHTFNKKMVTIEFGIADEAPKRNRMFYLISRRLPHEQWSPIYKSEVRSRDEMNVFESMSMGSQEFHSGDETKLFRLELHRWYKNGKSRPLGFAQTSFQKLASMQQNSHLYWWPAENGINSAKITIMETAETSDELRFRLMLSGS